MYNLFFFFQNKTAKVVEEEGFGLIDIILGSDIMAKTIYVVLLILSILAVYIFIERWLTIKKAGMVDDQFINNIRSSVQAGNIEGAKALCATTNTPTSRMVEKGIMRIGKPLKDIDAAIENVGNLEIFKLEKNLSTLASIAGAAPMIGFFGTVSGMILAFYTMSTADNVSPTELAGGIYVALITTAFGLVVGIVSFVGYNLLVANVEKVVYKMERTTMEFIDLLQEPSA